MARPLNYTFAVEGPLPALSFAEPIMQHNRPAIRSGSCILNRTFTLVLLHYTHQYDSLLIDDSLLLLCYNVVICSCCDHINEK